MYRNSLMFVLVALISCSLGCGERMQGPPVRPSRPDDVETGSVDKSVLDDSSTKPNSNSDEAKPTIKSVELIEATWNELQALVTAQQGKIVVVDIWSTACEPCMKEFPQLMTLQERHSSDVVAISYDIDFAGIKNKPPAYYRERVLHFLGSQRENQVLHRMCTTPADELFTELNLGSIPAIYVYGRDGKMVKRFEESDGQGEGLSYAKHVIPFIDELLK